MKLAVSSWPFSSYDRALHQRLADALRDAAVDLARQQQGIEGKAEVVDDRVADDRRLAGFGIDLDLAGMGAVRIGGARRRE